jgi:hypothetical protein
VLQQTLLASDGLPSDYFGAADSVVIDGEWAAVGAPTKEVDGVIAAGGVYIFKRTGDTWNQTQIIEPSSPITQGRFGNSMAMANGTLVVQTQDLGAGTDTAITIYSLSGSTWYKMQEFPEPVAGTNFGYRLAVSGVHMAVGANGATGAAVNSGTVRMYRRIGTVWTYAQTVQASDGANGDYFGEGIDLTDDWMVIGASAKNGNIGAAYVFKNTGGTWAQHQILEAEDGVAGDYFGYRNGISSTLLACGAPYHPNAPETNVGAVYAYELFEGDWRLAQKIQATIPVSDDGMGWVVLVQDQTIVSGVETPTGVGAFRTFEL